MSYSGDKREHDKFVLMEGLAEGNRFFTTNNPDETELEKCTLVNGHVAYRILEYADSTKEAQLKLSGRTFEEEWCE